MREDVLNRINDLFDSYDLFSPERTESVIRRIGEAVPGLTESETAEIKDYLRGFFCFCGTYGDKLAEKYKTPYLPQGKETDAETVEYVRICREKYPEIDEQHILSLFSVVCWLCNR